MAESNLSKIRPAFRTKGSMTGNFGSGKRVAGSPLNDITASSRESVGNFPTQEEYLSRLRLGLSKTTDPKLRRFLTSEIEKILRKSSQYEERSQPKPQGPYCDLYNHFIGSHQT